jgi:hypothetical protein
MRAHISSLTLFSRHENFNYYAAWSSTLYDDTTEDLPALRRQVAGTRTSNNGWCQLNPPSNLSPTHACSVFLVVVCRWCLYFAKWRSRRVHAFHPPAVLERLSRCCVSVPTPLRYWEFNTFLPKVTTHTFLLLGRRP